jgi:hypothetical protein
MSARPFETPYEYIDAAFDLLACRIQRLVAARESREADHLERGEPRAVGRGRMVADDDATRRVAVLTEREEQQGRDLEARLEAHRSAPEAKQLGIDRLAQAHGLGDEERTIVLSSLAFALSEERADQIHGDLGTGMYGSQSVECLMRVLDARTVEDRVRLRRLFRPESPLVKGGLIVLDYYGQVALPDDLLCARVRLSGMAFAILVGDGPALTVV